MTVLHTLLPASRTAVTWAICICMHLFCATGTAARDSTYIARSESRMAFRLFANNDFMSVIREYRDKEYTYKCNRPISIGFGYDNSQWAVFMNYKNHIVFPSISADDRLGISSGTITLGCAYRIL